MFFIKCIFIILVSDALFLISYSFFCNYNCFFLFYPQNYTIKVFPLFVGGVAAITVASLLRRAFSDKIKLKKRITIISIILFNIIIFAFLEFLRQRRVYRIEKYYYHKFLEDFHSNKDLPNVVRNKYFIYSDKLYTYHMNQKKKWLRASFNLLTDVIPDPPSPVALGSPPTHPVGIGSPMEQGLVK